METATRVKVSDVKKFFESDGGRKLGLPEMKDMKSDEKGWAEITAGIGDGTLTY